jgi:hypothetical protein
MFYEGTIQKQIDNTALLTKIAQMIHLKTYHFGAIGQQSLPK